MKLTAETIIASDRETVWRLSQTPELHARWDLRFTSIEYLPRDEADEAQRFRYTKRIGWGRAIEVQGWGTTIGDPGRSASALRFGSTDRRSLIREGAGSWTYREQGEGVSFSTIYDYTTRHGLVGRLLDLVFRPLMIWATRWSFDRLRLWIEDDIRPELALRLWIVKVIARCALAAVWIYEGLVPKILAQQPRETALVHDSGLYWGTASRTLVMLGAAEIVFGLWLLSGRAERPAAILSTAGVAILGALAVFAHPFVLADPFGGISKNLGLVACGLAICMLSKSSPMACRAAPKPRRPSAGRLESPFARALGNGLQQAAPLVRMHVAPAIGTHRYEGLMTSVWRASGLRRWLTAPFLWIGCWMHTLFPETGQDVPFAIVNRVFRGADGATRMTFERTFRFPGRERRFEATMHYDVERGMVLDYLGRHRHLLVELVASIEEAEAEAEAAAGAAITIRSRRQWLTPFGSSLRIPLPGMLVGDATIREWQDGESSLGIRVTISNQLFGPFFGYSGTFHRVDVSS